MRFGKNGTPADVTAAVLAGGLSHRMGADKALLPWADTSLLGHVLETVGGAFDCVVISAHDPATYAGFGEQVVFDTEPGRGPLCAIASVLAAVPTEWVFAVACDMPFLDPAVWAALAEHARGDADAVLPRSARGLEPLCAFYHQRCLPMFREHLAAGRLAIHDAMQDVRIVEVDIAAGATADTFANLNTHDEYAAALARHGGDA